MRTNITEFRCDRCGYCEGAREGALSLVEQRWRRLALLHVVPTEDAPFLDVELCPACAGAFTAWFERPADGPDAPASPTASG